MANNIPRVHEILSDRIKTYIESIKKSNKKGTIVLSAGDMFQGTAVSSMTRGRAIVDCMNIIGFDAMTIGNHELDYLLC